MRIHRGGAAALTQCKSFCLKGPVVHLGLLNPFAKQHPIFFKRAAVGLGDIDLVAKQLQLDLKTLGVLSRDFLTVFMKLHGVRLPEVKDVGGGRQHCDDLIEVVAYVEAIQPVEEGHRVASVEHHVLPCFMRVLYRVWNC